MTLEDFLKPFILWKRDQEASYVDTFKTSVASLFGLTIKSADPVYPVYDDRGTLRFLLVWRPAIHMDYKGLGMVRQVDGVVYMSDAISQPRDVGLFLFAEPSESSVWHVEPSVESLWERFPNRVRFDVADL